MSSLDLTTGTIPPAYCLNNNHECILEYLSYFVAPPGVDPNAPLQQIMIYGALNQEPPTAFSLRISKNYL